MARLEAQSKLLYYPTPPSVVETTASWFKTDGHTRLVDPCCGKGEALAQFTSLVDPKAETWGIEISYSRAVQAKELLNTVLSTSFYDMRPPGRWSNASVSLVFNNPPYDWSSIEENRNGQKRKVRHEVLFIEGTTPKIVPGGHQIIIVPRAMLGDSLMFGEGQEERLARHLLGWYEEVKVYRFPDGEYKRFKQVVILACNKRQKYQPPKKEAIDAITIYVEESTPLAVLPKGEGIILIPPIPAGKANFVYTPVDPGQLLQLGVQCSPIGTPAYERATYVRPIGAAFTPAMPLSVGHITMLIAGQETGVLSLPSEDGTILVKGMSRKVVDMTTRDNVNDKGQYSHTSVNEREKHVATITIAHQDGELDMLQSSTEVGDFVTKYADPIADAILQRNQPLYELMPEGKEWQVTGMSAKGLSPLPNREEKGLFDVQRHFAIAAARVMKARRHCILNAEMGFGKTSTSIASLELIDKWPVLVMCPGHMVWKWKRDIEVSCNPEEPFVARVITRPVLDKPPAWQSTIRPAIEAVGGEVLATTRTQVNPTTPNDPGGRRQVIIRCSCKSRMDVEKVIQKLAFKDKEAGETLQPKVRNTQIGLEAEFVDRDQSSLQRIVVFKLASGCSVSTGSSRFLSRFSHR
jgi:Uncharacterised methyltransferase family (DUF6094)